MSAGLHLAKEGIAWTNRTINVKSTIRISNSGKVFLEKETLVALVVNLESG
jgi:hypothetical protein